MTKLLAHIEEARQQIAARMLPPPKRARLNPPAQMQQQPAWGAQAGSGQMYGAQQPGMYAADPQYQSAAYSQPQHNGMQGGNQGWNAPRW